MGKVADAIDLLGAKAASMTGAELKELLIDLRFEVKACSTPNHFVVTHDGLAEFLSTSFDASHNKHMLPSYPRQIRRVLKQYQTQLENLLESENGKT